MTNLNWEVIGKLKEKTEIKLKIKIEKKVVMIKAKEILLKFLDFNERKNFPKDLIDKIENKELKKEVLYSNLKIIIVVIKKEK